MDFNELSNYLVIAVVGVCCCVGYIIKTSLDFIPNKYIPLILAVTGVITNICLAQGFNVEVLLGGMFSGLASTGCHEAFRNMKHNKNNDDVISREELEDIIDDIIDNENNDNNEESEG